MNKSPDFFAIGDVVTDAFIRLQDAEVKECIDHHRQELSLSFGDKVPYEFVKVLPAVGNSANAAVSAARLGLSSGLISDIGEDANGKEAIDTLVGNKVITDYITKHKGLGTNYHYVLWYDVERTILVKHELYTYKFPKLAHAPKWIYLSSLGSNSLDYHHEILTYLQAHPEVKLAFQPGTYQMKFGVEALKGIYERSDIFFCNVEEAQRILKTETRDLKTLMADVRKLGPKIVVITDGIAGAYASDGNEAWFMPVYPQDPYERTGAGDAFASTVTVALALGKSLEDAMTWGPVNSASVVQKIGAQEGLLSQEKLLEMIEKAPADYKIKKI
jgi:ribokinase